MKEEIETPARRRFGARFSTKSRFITVIVVLIVAMIAMLIMWKPWNSNSNRTVQVTGETTIKAEPDEYVFTPSYTFRTKDNAGALAEANKKGQEVVKKFKELGVADNKIKSNVSGYEEYAEKGPSGMAYTVMLTVVVSERELAEKLQEYVFSTSPSGNVSPQAKFSDSKRKELEQRARDAAFQDAKSKAEQDARHLGFKVGKVKEVQDSGGFGDIPIDLAYEGRPADYNTIGSGLLPGENELRYSVNVTFFVR